MLAIPSPAKFSAAVVALSEDPLDWPFIERIAGKMPARFAGRVMESYGQKRQASGQFEANQWLLAKQDITAKDLDLSSSDAEICAYARAQADEVKNRLAERSGIIIPEALKGWLVDYAERFDCVFPKPVGAMSLHGIVGRMTDQAWWRRNLRRAIGRRIEAQAIELGFVHRRAGLYASDETVKAHGEQQQRNRRSLEQTEATNEEGYTATLAELSEVGVSNPRIRRAELMTRIAGFEGYAKALGHVGMFYTATAPSRMHARLSVSGQVNPKYDGTGPRDCAAYLSKTWAKARAWLHRRGIHIYGFRVAEPHHDGTPHWHMLFFMVAEVVESVTHCLRRYFCEADAHELSSETAQKARFAAVKIDWSRGSAAGYIAKYIAKNIDGKRNDGEAACSDLEDEKQSPADETAPRVLAWSSRWGIRQFQQIGGPGVTVWRELRRIRDMKQGDLFDTWSAADAGNWQAFMERQGGNAGRDAQPVKLWSEALPGKRNRYGEDAGKEVCGVELAGVCYETRRHVWEIRRKDGNSNRMGDLENGGAGMGVGGVRRVLCAGYFELGQVFQIGRASGPWTRVNNCTRPAPPGAWEGIAANIAAHANLGRKDVVGEIFEQLRRLKSGKSTGSGTEGEKGVGSRAAAREGDGRRLR